MINGTFGENDELLFELDLIANIAVSGQLSAVSVSGQLSAQARQFLALADFKLSNTLMRSAITDYNYQWRRGWIRVFQVGWP